jgi:hypothetical protein
MTSGTTVDLLGIWGSSATDVFAVASDGTILHYDGSSWIGVLSTGTTLYDIWGSSSSDVLAVRASNYGTNSFILRYDGVSWKPMEDGNNSYPFYAVHGTSSSDIWAVGYYGVIFHFDGIAWAQMTGPSMIYYGVWAASSSDVFAVGNAGVAHYDGSAWSGVSSGATKTLNGVWGSSASNIFAVGDGGTLIHFNGAWSPMSMSSGTTNSLSGVWGSSPSDVFAVGQYGTILHYDGTTWNSMSRGTTSGLRGAWGTSSSNVYAPGDGATVMHYDGIRWIPVATGATGSVLDVWGSSSSDIYVVGYSHPDLYFPSIPSIIHWNGQSWSQREVPAGSHEGRVNGVWFSSSSDVFAVGLCDAYYAYQRYDIVLHYDGSSWTQTQMNTGTALDLRDVWGASSHDVFAVAASGDILHYDGGSWSTATKATKGLAGIWGTSSSDIFAVGVGGTILHYDGSMWGVMTSGTTSDLFGVYGTSPSDVYAVGAGGTILHYDGDAWTSMNGGTTKALNGVWASSAADVFAVGESGTILHLGESVAAYTLTTAIDPGGSGTIVLTPSKPGNVYAAGSNVALVAIANQGYEFDRWTGDLSGSQNPATVTMDSNKVIMANFTGDPTDQPPNQPSNAWPAVGATDIAVDATLVSSAFSDPDAGDTHAASQWQITQTSGEYSGPTFDSGADTSNLISITIPEGELSLSSTYYWRVRHLDNRGTWSEWSSETSFTTEATPNQPPAQPSNVSPAGGAADVNLSPALSSSAFSDPDTGDTHAASQWQVTATSGDYSSPVFDSGTDNASLTEVRIPSDTLSGNTTYYWKVRHQDNHGKWSNYSTETSFTTAVTQAPDQPSNVSPANGSADVSLTPTLSSSAFVDPDIGDTHAASRWQVTATSGDYSSPVFDSGTDNVSLTQIGIPIAKLTNDAAYYWRVRYQDSHGKWSSYSNETSFTTAASGSGDDGGTSGSKGFPLYIVGVVGGVVLIGASTGYLWRKRRLAALMEQQLKQWEDEGYDVSEFKRKWPSMFRT